MNVVRIERDAIIIVQGSSCECLRDGQWNRMVEEETAEGGTGILAPEVWGDVTNTSDET